MVFKNLTHIVTVKPVCSHPSNEDCSKGLFIIIDWFNLLIFKNPSDLFSYSGRCSFISSTTVSTSPKYSFKVSLILSKVLLVLKPSASSLVLVIKARGLFLPSSLLILVLDCSV